MADEAAALAAALSARGLRRGAHVALIGDNRPRLYAAMGAAQWLGAVPVPLYQHATADEMEAPLRSAEAAFAFAEDQEQADKLLELLPRCPTVRCIVYDKDRGMRHYKQPQLVSYAALLREGRELAASGRDLLQAEAGRGSGGDAAFVFFTPGTSGPAKGVVLTHAALIGRARAAAAAEGLKDTDVTMAYLPPGWIGQNFFAYALPMVAGYCVCCPESSETMLADMREIGPTCFLATPRVLEALHTQVSERLGDSGGLSQGLYRRCMAAARRAGARALAGEAASLGGRLASVACDLSVRGPLRDVLGMSRLRVAYAAGDAASPDLLMFFRALGVNLKQLYGSTETGFLVAVQRDGDVKPDTVGPAAEGVELGFTPQREILVRSPGLFREYHRDPQATARASDPEGWFRTGDMGHLGDDGHLRIVGRLADVGSLRDGTPYAPGPIENRLKFFPYIREVVAFGDGCHAVCALLDIDTAAVGRWADDEGISYSGHADLASREEVYGLVAGCVAEVNAELAGDPELARLQVHRFLILPKELDADDGVLTRTGKLRRGAIAERYSSKKGFSAKQLQRNLGLGSYESAWFMAHRIRHAVATGSFDKGPLSGTVEVDETYVGGKPRNGAEPGKTGRGTKKTAVVALVERGGKVRSMPVERVNADTLKGAIRENVDKSSTIVTDEWAAYKGIGQEFAGGHHVVNHGAKEYVRGEAYTNTVESYFALLKRGVYGTFHHVSKKHLPRYCDEFSFRWDHRDTTDGERCATAIARAAGKRLTYHRLLV